MPKLVVRHLLAAALVSVALCGADARGQYQKPAVGSMDKVVEPYQPGEVGVDEHLGSFVPQGDAFVDEDAKPTTLNAYLHHGRPVILWLGYYDCPMLCDRMTGGLVRALRDVKLDGGREYAIVHVSINPDEVAGLAKQKKINYGKELGQPEGAKGWSLLTGQAASIASLTNAVGYKFKPVKVDSGTEFAHPAALVVLSPEGKVARYLYPAGGGDLTFDPSTLRLSLIEASDGKVGSTLDKVMLTCLRWDEHAGKYTWVAVALMKYAAGLTVLIMGSILVPLWIRAARRKVDHGTGPAGGTLATR